MKCCIRCFSDSHIKDTINRLGAIGDCDFCSAQGVKVFDISNPNLISDKIIGLIQAYEESDDIDAKPLLQALKDDWKIFSGDEQRIKKLLIALCPQILKDARMFSKKVSIPQAKDVEYLREYGVVKGLSWDEFSENIKYGNRFFNKMFNYDAFASFLSTATKSFGANTKLFRARIAPDKNGFSPKDMCAPPKEFRRAGRVNPEGIGVLYLASDMDTALKEVRANTYDYVTVGDFIAQKDLIVVDLSAISKMSPFLYQGDIEQFFINRQAFQDIALEIAKPLRRNDSPLEYLPTQYISEFIKSQGYDGVAYESTMNPSGYNIAVYNETLFECNNVTTVEVKKVNYEFVQ